jgi:hypothetical protein
MGAEAGALGKPLTIFLTWSPTVPALCQIRWVLRLVRWVTVHYSLYLESHSASHVPNKMGVEAGALVKPLTIVFTWSPTVPALC